MFILSIFFGILPLLGIGWILAQGTLTTVDGLFMSLILLTMSGVFFLSAFLELRSRRELRPAEKKPASATAASPSQKQ
jgi:TRAP-type C4-dicarboxylate transport system permease small subunit